MKFRAGKTTPTKIGQFVTLWKRNEKGITEPYNIWDAFDLYIIATRKEDESGVFIFPASVLHDNKILSGENGAGKRGFRVYPGWSLPTDEQALKSQGWQMKFYLEILRDIVVNTRKPTALITLGR